MQFNPQVEKAVGLLIKRRADAAFNGSGAACVTAIIEHWISLGCPPLNDAELGLLAIGKLPGVKSGKSLPSDGEGPRKFHES